MSMRSLYRTFSILLLCGVLALGPVVAEAGDSWFSKARTRQIQPGDGVIAGASRDSNLTVFDVTISLYNDPSGDEDPGNDVGNEEQTVYEEIVRHWADSVCEQSNGGHRLGKVRIFRNGDHGTRADVRWNASEGPRAHIAGFGTSGLHIFFGDIFPDGNVTSDKDMLMDPEGAGYTLGHEWGHYVYALYDEYEGNKQMEMRPSFPQVGDVPTSPSIMNSQWNARGGNFAWLNHSTQDNIGDPEDTAQGRVYGRSGWEVLLQDTDDDPKAGRATAQPERTRYTALGGLEPTAADGWVREELPGDQTVCRSDLEIVWMDSSTSQLVIDVSGSMAGTPLDNARKAGQNLVEIFPEGNNSALGLVSFDSIATQSHPITPIPDPGDTEKAAIQSAIAALTAGGTTAMYDAAQLALDNLQAFSGGGAGAEKVVFLLSDGMDNSSTATLGSVVSAYQAASVPLITFGYGSGAPGGVLRQLADDTGGEFFSSPTTLAEILNAFLAANTAVSESVAVASAALPTGTGLPMTETFEIDPSLASFVAFVTYEGGIADVDLDLLSPGGGSSGIPFTCEQVGTEVSCLAEVDDSTLSSLGAGTWAVSAESTSVDPVRVAVVAQPGTGRTYDVRLASASGNTVRYPEPLVLTAAISRELPITGVQFSARITDPTGATSVLDMNDEGRDGDAAAGDGIYSVITGYERDGLYSVEVGFDNSAGTARFTLDGLQPSHPSPAVDGTLPPPPPLPPINENFTRFARLQVTVEGSTLDDHLPGAPGTPHPGGNAGLAGNIDGAGDIDCFAIPAPDPLGNLVVRVTDLALGMDPVLEVFSPDGATLIDRATLPEDASVNGYLFTEIPAANASAGVLACVRHQDDSAGQGSYRVSAGPRIVSDGNDVGQQPVVEIPTLGQFGLALMVFLLLGFATLILRRRPTAA